MADYRELGYANDLTYNAQASTLPELASLSGATDSGSAVSVTEDGVLGSAEEGDQTNVDFNSVDPTQLRGEDLLEQLNMGQFAYIKGGVTAYRVGEGFFLGWDKPLSKFVFFVGDSAGDNMYYDGTDLFITGNVSATSGTIGGFVIGADYIRDAANTFGLASTVTGGNDVRFWAGDTFANRAIAPARILENGRADFSELYINGSEVTSSGTDLTGASGRGPIVTGASIITTSAAIGGNNMVGYSDATTKRFIVSKYEAAADLMYMKIGLSVDFGADLYQAENISRVNQGAAAGSFGIVQIGNDVWLSGVNGGETWKNGSAVTVSGTARIGPIGHDPTNSYLLVNYSTTQIARFTGISGTTITNANSDITLDAAIDNTKGFAFDNTNTRYICIDTSNNVIRRFNSSGTTIDTVAYTIDDTLSAGVVILYSRVYIVLLTGVAQNGGASSMAVMSAKFIPTTMTI